MGELGDNTQFRDNTQFAKIGCLGTCFGVALKGGQKENVTLGTPNVDLDTYHLLILSA